jgi:hypothetical protein
LGAGSSGQTVYAHGTIKVLDDKGSGVAYNCCICVAIQLRPSFFRCSNFQGAHANRV